MVFPFLSAALFVSIENTSLHFISFISYVFANAQEIVVKKSLRSV